MFFARHVLLCEGASEKVYVDYLGDSIWQFIRENRVYVLDCLGKFNIHRFVALLTELGIPHSILFDGDRDRGHHEIWNRIVNDSATHLTAGIHQFENDLEDYLGIEKPASNRNDLKPINIINKHIGNEIDAGKQEQLKEIVSGLVRV